ncbi:MAG: V-type ATP synthase subunit B [Oscillospiraceae bacterium]|jgi:V/A-type H+-transporting ATPase subunit B|nr:V-type ATP synthase subunit B [Oscillospiraceae bacterium]
MTDLQYAGLERINGPLVVLSGAENVSYEEIALLKLKDGSERAGRVVEMSGDKVVLQVFEGTKGLSLKNTRTVFTGKPLEIPLGAEMLGRIFNGAGEPIDGLGGVFPEKMGDINGRALNPVSRAYPRDYIHTGISSIDCLMTLIRGQKLPIFSGSGLSHNKLAAQIAGQARLSEKGGETGGEDYAGENAGDDKFAVVFAAIGVPGDTADYFKRVFEENGALDRVAMFLNLSNDPIIERILTPRCALTAAEYLAFEKNMHILAIMTDLTAYAEALREFSSSKGEIPGRKGYPGYLYSDLASLYERAGVVKGSGGSLTQIPILTMPNDDITHPVPDLTAYITEGQIVFDRNLDGTGVYPGLSVLLSLSRLMKDGVGDGFTRRDHPDLANQVFSSYAKVQDARALASVIGEDELSPQDKALMKFGAAFEKNFLNQRFDEDRSMEETLNLAWDLLCLLPRGELERLSDDLLNENYDPKRAERFNPPESRESGQNGEI